MLSIQRVSSLLRGSVFAFDLRAHLSTSSQATKVAHVHPVHSETMENSPKHRKWRVYITWLRGKCTKFHSDMSVFPRLVSPGHSAVLSSAFPWASSSLTNCNRQTPRVLSCPSILLGTSKASSLFSRRAVLPKFLTNLHNTFSSKNEASAVGDSLQRQWFKIGYLVASLSWSPSSSSSSSSSSYLL